jgi:hypothetical protein
MESWPLWRERSTHAPLAPLRAKAVSSSLPIPRAAPVTTQVLPSRDKDGRVMRFRRGREAARGRMDLPKRQRQATGERREVIATEAGDNDAPGQIF